MIANVFEELLVMPLPLPGAHPTFSAPPTSLRRIGNRRTSGADIVLIPTFVGRLNIFGSDQNSVAHGPQELPLEPLVGPVAW